MRNLSILVWRSIQKSKANAYSRGAFGSCRHKLKISMLIKENIEGLLMYFRRIILVTFYNGGGDSQDTTTRLLNTL